MGSSPHRFRDLLESKAVWAPWLAIISPVLQRLELRGIKPLSGQQERGLLRHTDVVIDKLCESRPG